MTGLGGLRTVPRLLNDVAEKELELAALRAQLDDCESLLRQVQMGLTLLLIHAKKAAE